MSADLLWTGVAALAASLAITPLAARVARRLGVLDHPGGYKAHGSPTPLLGGVAVTIAAAVPVTWGAAGLPANGRGGLVALGAGVVILLAAGLWDDLRALPPRYKLAFQLVAAAIAGILLAASGVRLRVYLDWPMVPIVLLTTLWVLVVTNAVNFMDNMNGACAGQGAISAAALAAINLRSGEPAVALLSAALAGACLGFVPFNWPRARLFLGDAGSGAIGFALAGLAVMGVYARGPETTRLAVLAPLAVLSLPLFDLALVVGLRLREGHPPWVGDRRHLSHRLVRRGLRPPVAVATLWLFAGLGALVGCLLPTADLSRAVALLLLLGGALVALALAAGKRGLS